LRIGFVSPYYYPAMIGGIEWYLYHVSRLLARKGHEVEVFTTNAGATRKDLPAEEDSEGVRIHRFRPALDVTYRIKLWPSLIPRLRSNDLQVVHAFDYAQFHDLAVALARASSGWRSVVTVYDVHSQIPRAPAKSAALRVFDHYLAGAILRAFDKVLVRTPYQAEFARGLGIGEERLELAPPGIDDESFEEVEAKKIQEVRARYACDGSHMILYVGRIHPIKGIDVLIRALAWLKGRGLRARLIVVGPDQSGYTPTLQRLASTLDVAGMVIFTGYLEEDEKRRLQAASDVAVLPSSFEGFGQALIQAMAHGTPVIGTNVGGIPWVLEQGNAGLLVPYGDHVSLAKSIERIVSDDDLRRSLVQRGRERARQFSYPALVENLEAIYRRLCAT